MLTQWDHYYSVYAPVRKKVAVVWSILILWILVCLYKCRILNAYDCHFRLIRIWYRCCSLICSELAIQSSCADLLFGTLKHMFKMTSCFGRYGYPAFKFWIIPKLWFLKEWSFALCCCWRTGHPAACRVLLDTCFPKQLKTCCMIFHAGDVDFSRPNVGWHFFTCLLSVRVHRGPECTVPKKWA